MLTTHFSGPLLVHLDLPSSDLHSLWSDKSSDTSKDLSLSFLAFHSLKPLPAPLQRCVCITPHPLTPLSSCDHAKDNLQRQPRKHQLSSAAPEGTALTHLVPAQDCSNFNREICTATWQKGKKVKEVEWARKADPVLTHVSISAAKHHTLQ